MSHQLDQKFGPIRSLFWPIHASERKKIIPMLLMIFFICFNYNILRNMKDALVVTASGAEVIPFIKVWVMLPSAVLITLLFAKLSNRFSQEKVFYIMISGFLFMFGMFAFVIYPMHDSLHPYEMAKQAEAALPAGFRGLIAMCCNWSFTCFYVLCELWGSAILSVMFWGFANEVVKVSEARRFYGVLGVAGSISTILSAQLAIFISQTDMVNTNIALGGDTWEQTLTILVSVIIISGILTMGIFYWMSRKVLTDPCFDEFHHNKKEIKKKRKLSVRESFSYLSNSKYLACIAVIVFSYNLVINLVEIVWKDQLRVLYPAPADYNNYMSNVTTVLGIVATVTALFMAKIINSIGWTWTALITPLMMLVTCFGFFSCIFFPDQLAGIFTVMAGLTPLALAAFFGGAQNSLSKAAKYSVFDMTKEMAFIPLSHESKLKGKAAIDGVGSRLGKSGGSLVHQGLLMFFGTVASSAPYVAAILLVVIVLWITAVRTLGVMFNAAAAIREKDAAAARQKELEKEPLSTSSEEAWQLSSHVQPEIIKA